ncbi:MAG: hypothetical protein JWL67_1713, partial [Solirubrobacterales bacterium]|nr:hypothetical protein [Solirubrobacterales bacterium]
MGDPEDPTASSGWPASVLGALREVVERVEAIPDTPYRGWSRAAFAAGALLGMRASDLREPSRAKARLWTVGQGSAIYAAARARSVNDQVERLGPLDGLVQNGGDYRAPPEVPMVTYQDST